MKHVHYDEVQDAPVEVEGAKDARIRWLIDDTDGALNFCMRRFDLAAGGHTPTHVHAWEHEIYFLEGEGSLQTTDGPAAFRPGDVVYVAPFEQHGIAADRGVDVAFLCLIPNSGKHA